MYIYQKAVYDMFSLLRFHCHTNIFDSLQSHNITNVDELLDFTVMLNIATTAEQFIFEDISC